MFFSILKDKTIAPPQITCKWFSTSVYGFILIYSPYLIHSSFEPNFNPVHLDITFVPAKQKYIIFLHTLHTFQSVLDGNGG